MTNTPHLLSSINSKTGPSARAVFFKNITVSVIISVDAFLFLLAIKMVFIQLILTSYFSLQSSTPSLQKEVALKQLFQTADELNDRTKAHDMINTDYLKLSIMQSCSSRVSE